MLAYVSDDGTVNVWDTQKKQLINEFKAHARYVSALAFSPDGVILASGSHDKTVRLLDVKAKKALFSLKANDYIFSLGFSPDGTIVAAGSRGEVILFDVRTGKIIKTLQVGSVPHSLAFHPSGTALVVPDEDHKSIVFFLAGR